MPVLTEVDATKRADEERLQGGSETRDREVEPPPLPTKSDQAQQGPLETNGEGELTREFKLHRYLAGDHRVGDRAAVVRSPALGMARRNREGMANGEEQNGNAISNHSPHPTPSKHNIYYILLSPSKKFLPYNSFSPTIPPYLFPLYTITH